MNSSGYIYAFSLGNGSTVKCGKTTSSDPLGYIKRSLRLVSSLYIIEIYRVPDVGIAEKILLRTLQRFRTDPKHELFEDTSPERIQRAFETVRRCMETMAYHDYSLRGTTRLEIKEHDRHVFHRRK